MNAQAQGHDELAGGAALRRREYLAYFWGVGVALVLTLAAFAVVQWHFAQLKVVCVVIAVLALAQMVVHFRFFLHIGLKRKREDLQLILFSALVLTILVAGTLWIMFNLAGRMVLPTGPMPPTP